MCGSFPSCTLISVNSSELLFLEICIDEEFSLYFSPPVLLKRVWVCYLNSNNLHGYLLRTRYIKQKQSYAQDSSCHLWFSERCIKFATTFWPPVIFHFKGICFSVLLIIIFFKQKKIWLKKNLKCSNNILIFDFCVRLFYMAVNQVMVQMNDCL